MAGLEARPAETRATESITQSMIGNQGFTMHALIKSEQAKKYLIFAVVIIGASLGSLTQTALNTMASDVLADLGSSINWGQWLTTAYMLTMGIAVPLASFLIKKLPVKQLLIVSFLLFIAGALCDTIAWNFPTLLIGRILEAGATGLLMPLVQTLAMTSFPEGRNATAMGIAGIALGFAPNFGPTLGGLCIASIGWRSLFFAMAIFALVLLGATIALLDKGPSKDSAAKLESLSLVLAALAFSGLQVGLTNAASFPIAHLLVVVPTIVGALCLAAFVRRQLHLDEPLIEMSIFHSPNYPASFAAQCFLYASFLGTTLIVPLFIENACGGSALDAGIVLLPGTFTALVLEPLAGAAADRYGVRPVLLVGGAFLTVGGFAMATLDAEAPLWLATACHAVRMVGVATLIGPLTSWGLQGLGERTSDGSAFVIMSRQISAALATAIMVFLITSFGDTADPLVGYRLGLGFSGLCGALSLACIAAKIR